MSAASAAEEYLRISEFPNEILLTIFEKLPTGDVFNNIQHVCKRWKGLCQNVLKRIDVDDRIPRKNIITWIKASPQLKHFKITKREDLDVILEVLCRNCPDLEILEMEECRGSSKRKVLNSVVLRNLLKNCENLRTLCLDRKMWYDNCCAPSHWRFRVADDECTADRRVFDFVYQHNSLFGNAEVYDIELDIIFTKEKVQIFDPDIGDDYCEMDKIHCVHFEEVM